MSVPYMHHAEQVLAQVDGKSSAFVSTGESSFRTMLCYSTEQIEVI